MPPAERLLDAFTDVAEIAGDDPVATFRTYRALFLEATDRRGALQTPVASRVGDMTIDSYMAFMRSDTFVHTWDVARGAGIDAHLDPKIVSVILADYLERDMTPLRVPERYDDERSVTDDADELARLIAFTGRDPEWQPN